MVTLPESILRAREALEADVIDRPGVTGVDVGYKVVGGRQTDQLAVRVLVAQKRPLTGLAIEHRVPPRVAGHPTDVIQRSFALSTAVEVAPADLGASRIDGGRYDPLRGGIGIGPLRLVEGYVHVGTLGAVVADDVTQELLGLGSFHALCVDEESRRGDLIVQPSRLDGGDEGDVIGRISRHALTDTVDAALVSITHRSLHLGVAEVGHVTGAAEPRLGESVQKRGRSTRLTIGVVDGVHLTARVDFGPTLGVRVLRNQIGVRADQPRSVTFGEPGDSGSVVVNGNREVIGLLCSGDPDGYGVLNPIKDVLEALHVNLRTGPALTRCRRPARPQCAA